MKFWVATGPSVAALLFVGSAMAEPPSTERASSPGDATAAFRPVTDAVAQIATVTEAVAQLASTASVSPPPAAVPETPTRTAAPQTAASPAAPAKRTAPRGAVDVRTPEKTAKHAGAAARRQRLAAAEPEPAAVRAVGRVETGTAAWYGGRYIGRRTTSGERLDTVHATAAHRTLPLNCLARVTNLRNGRSVVVRVTDRGPIAEELLIDMSPRAADELRMKEAGVVPVRVEQVVQVVDGDK